MGEITEKVNGKLPSLPYNINEVISISAGVVARGNTAF